jgi:3-oxoadipate enol-lactonase
MSLSKHDIGKATRDGATDLTRVTMDDGAVLTACVESIDPAAPWVLFSNSLATNMSIWDSQTAALSGRYNILRFDQRGHGTSGLKEAPLGFFRLASDIIALLDHFEITSTAYVGLSMGVPTGLAAYSMAPQRFSGLLLSDGQAKTAPGGETQWRERINLAKAQGMATVAEATARRWLAEPTGAPLAGLTRMIAATPLKGYVACAEALASFDLDAVLAKLDVPVLLVAGERDDRMPDTMRAMAERISGARFETVTEAGHVPCYERPEAFNALLLPFVEHLT